MAAVAAGPLLASNWLGPRDQACHWHLPAYQQHLSMDLLRHAVTHTTVSSTALQPVFRTHLWVVGAQLINGTELDQFLVDAEKGKEESMSRLCTGRIVLYGTSTTGSRNDDKEMKPLNPAHFYQRSF